MIRRQKLLSPTRNTRDAKIFVVATEGAQDERLYFEAFNPEASQKAFTPSPLRVEVVPTPDGASAPQHVLSRVKAATRDLGLDPRDEIWLVLDVDRWQSRTLAQVISQAKRAKIKVAVSNPCFEVWLCLHFESCTDAQIARCCAQGAQSAQALKRLWKSHLPASATRIQRDHVKPKTLLALRRAADLDKGNVSDAQPWPAPATTRLHLLMQRILEAVEA